MAWKSYSLGYLPWADVVTATAEKLTEIFGYCVADTSAYNVTLSYGGNDYVVGFKYLTSLNSYNTILFVNDETGAFIVSAPKTESANSTTKYENYIYCALLEIQTESNKTELVVCTGATANYGRVFGLIYNAGASGDYNNTDFISLVPLTTGGKYNTAVTRSLFRPVVGLFNSNVSHIPVGAVIEVAGQRFICVSCGLFAKL